MVERKKEEKKKKEEGRRKEEEENPSLELMCWKFCIDLLVRKLP